MSPRSMSPRSVHPIKLQASPRALASSPRHLASKGQPISTFPNFVNEDMFFPTRSARGQNKTGVPHMPDKPKFTAPKQSKPTAVARVGASAIDEEAALAEKREKEKMVSMTTEAIHGRFKNMRDAFKYIDLDASGTVDKAEITRALRFWNIPIEDDKLDKLMSACDVNADGAINYDEFVDALARDTVAPDAMGKRGLTVKEAMGVEDLDPSFLGHDRKIQNTKFVSDDERYKKSAYREHEFMQ